MRRMNLLRVLVGCLVFGVVSAAWGEEAKPAFLARDGKYNIVLAGGDTFFTVVIVGHEMGSWYYVKQITSGEAEYRWINFDNVTIVEPVRE